MNAGLERVMEGYRAYLLDLGIEDGVSDEGIAALVVAEVMAEHGAGIVDEAAVVELPTE